MFYMRKFPLLLTLVIVCWFGVGCSQTVTVSHKSKATQSVLAASDVDSSQYILPTKVLVQPQLMLSKHQKDHMGLFIAGPQNKWTVNLNEALPDAIQTAALKTYSQVEIGKSCDDCGLVFRPVVKRVGIDKLSMRTTVEIDVLVYNAYNSKIAHIHAVGKSPLMDISRFSTGIVGYFVPFFGTAMGKNIIAKTSRRALNEAVSHFHEQITEETESGILARYWLPKAENRDYAIGKHQFPAERVAMKAGCSMHTDEIRLVSQNFHQESYMANCWRKPSMAIDCEYGRCALRETDKRLAQKK